MHDAVKTWIRPEWPAHRRVHALVTTRQGGVSQSPYDTMNLADHVGDNPDHVLKNRQHLQSTINRGVQPTWLEQVHGTDVVTLTQNSDKTHTADASCTQTPSVACAILTADCLPVLFANQQGDWVAAAHAGWRGLASGVLENTVDQYPGATQELLAWMGPAIGPQQFEVGDDVRAAFCDVSSDLSIYFKPSGTKFFADLYGIARAKLELLGITVFGGGFCTYNQSDLFYSYRRDGQTGRMASLIWIDE